MTRIGRRISTIYTYGGSIADGQTRPPMLLLPVIATEGWSSALHPVCLSETAGGRVHIVFHGHPYVSRSL